VVKIAESFVDLTTRNPSDVKREVRLTPEDIEIIEKNPRGLTKEGCMVKVWQWLQSNNFPLIMRYLAMYKMCKTFTKSGTMDDGSIILAKKTYTTNQGIQRQYLWKEKIGQKDREGNIIIAKDIETLETLVKDRLNDLKFLVSKG